IALSLLLVGVAAIGLSTMSSSVAAALCTIRYDILPALWPQSEARDAGEPSEAVAMRHTIAGGALCLLAVAAGFWFAQAHLRIGLASSTFLALLFAIACPQLS